MKKLIFATAALLLSLSVSAQHHHKMKNMSPDERAEMVVQHISDEVEINEDEKQHLTAIHVEHFTQKQQMREEGNEDKEQHRQMREEKQAAVQNILGEERFVQLTEARQERRAKHREKKRERTGKMRNHLHKHQDAAQPQK